MNSKNPNLPVLFLSVTIIFCTLAEFAIIGPQVFTGGHNKTTQLLTFFERATFLLAYLALTIILYWGAYLIWRTVLRKFDVLDSIIGFHYMMIAVLATAISLIISYHLHTYFADAMDAALVKEMAGGDVKTALVYVLDEAVLLVIGVIVSVALYYLVYRLVRGILYKYDKERIQNSRVGTRKIVYIFCGLLVVGVFTFSIGKIDFLRSNLSKFNGYTLVSSIFNIVSDVDGDGFGIFRYPQDTQSWNANIYPGALDVPGNGIDEDGFFGDFVGYSPTRDYKPKANSAEKPKHIVTIFLESARAELPNKTLDGILVAPNLHALAKEGYLVEEAYSHTGHTDSSLSSFFSGRLGNFDSSVSLFPILKEHGYRIAIFSGQDESWGGIDKELATRENTDHFYDAQVGVDDRVFSSRRPVSLKLSGETIWKKFEAYSQTLDWSNPQFIYFNLQAGHFPYFHKDMPPKFVEKGIPRAQIKVENRDWLARTYWNAMSYADTTVGSIIAELKKRGVWDETLLIVSGDHGEELFDNNHLGHGFFLSEVQTRIPLVINKADIELEQPVGQTEMKNIILAYAFNDHYQASNPDTSSNKAVFQIITPLDTPREIAFRYSSGKQLAFDMKRMLVRGTDGKQWIPYSEAIEIPEIEPELKKLVLHWENLRWQSHLNRTEEE